MPQLTSDEAANDEPKTYNDEAVGDDWQDNSNELEHLKGDLVGEGDPDPRRQSYDNKNSPHGESGQRRKSGSDRDSTGGSTEASARGGGAGGSNFPYNSQDLLMQAGFNPNHLPLVMPPSSQMAYNPYVHYQGLAASLYGSTSTGDLEAKAGMSRGHPDIPSMYSLPGQLGQIPHPLSVAAPWSSAPMYPALCSATVANMLRHPYPFGPFPSTSGGISPFLPIPAHTGAMHPAAASMLHPGLQQLSNGSGGQHGAGAKQPMADKKILNHHHHHGDHGVSGGGGGGKPRKEVKDDKPNRPYVKKPLNAFMLYMKEQRAKVVAECTLKESAAINQILGRKWHSLNRDEQQKYYEMARKERQIHMQMFPGWSARDNYGKRKKRKKEKTHDCTAQNPKKCRAVFGLEQQQLWCAPCRRKKKCVRYQHDGDDSDLDDSDSDLHYQGSPENLTTDEQRRYRQSPPSLLVTPGGGGFTSEPQLSSSSSASPSFTPSLSAGSGSGGGVGQVGSGAGSRLLPSSGTAAQRLIGPPTIKREQQSPPDIASGLVKNGGGVGFSHTASSPFHTTHAAADASSLPPSHKHHHNNNNSGNCVAANKPRPRPPHHAADSNNDSSTIPRQPQQQQQQAKSSGDTGSGGGHRNHRRASAHHHEPLHESAAGGGGGGQNPFFNHHMNSAAAHHNPFSTSHLFQPYLANMHAAANHLSQQAGNPLGGLMAFSGFKSLSSGAMGLAAAAGLNSAPSPTHPLPGTSRHTTSALEGKS